MEALPTGSPNLHEHRCKTVAVGERQIAKVDGLLFHDMRRSANHNMRDAGLPQSMRMNIMGHKTAAMDRRYGIVDLTDIQLARELLAKKPPKASAKSGTAGKRRSDWR